MPARGSPVLVFSKPWTFSTKLPSTLPWVSNVSRMRMPRAFSALPPEPQGYTNCEQTRDLASAASLAREGEGHRVIRQRTTANLRFHVLRPPACTGEFDLPQRQISGVALRGCNAHWTGVYYLSAACETAKCMQATEHSSWPCRIPRKPVQMQVPLLLIE